MDSDNDRRVFIIHGRNLRVVSEVSKFLQTIGLIPWRFEDIRSRMGANPFIDDVVWEGITSSAAAIALFTPDESATLRDEYRLLTDARGDRARWQSRANVLYEAGLALGWLKGQPSRQGSLLLAVIGPVELPSDFAGRFLFELSNDPEQRRRLRQHFVQARCLVNDSSAFNPVNSLNGDFDEAVLVGLSSAGRIGPPQVPADGDFLMECCKWLPALLRLERMTLDLAESEMYVNRPPSSAADLRGQLADLNLGVQLYNTAVGTMRHHTRINESSLRKFRQQTPMWLDLEQAVSVAGDVNPCPEYLFPPETVLDDASPRGLTSTHRAVNNWFFETRKRLTNERGRLVAAVQRVSDEVRRQVRVGVPLRFPPVSDTLPCSSLRDDLTRYFSAVVVAVNTLQERVSSGDHGVDDVRAWCKSVLTPALIELNSRTACIHDAGMVKLVGHALQGLPHATAVELSELIDSLNVFHLDRVRPALNTALVPLYELEQDADAPVRPGLDLVGRTLRDNHATFQVELPDYERRAVRACAGLPDNDCSKQ